MKRPTKDSGVRAVHRDVIASKPPRTGNDQVRSLVRALTLLNRIAEAPDGCVNLTDLARQVELPPSTVHRLLTTLEQERFARFDAEGRVWSVGVQAFVTGCTFTKTRSLVGLARPHMRRLMEESGETVNLGVEDNGMAVYMAQIECRQVMRSVARPGSRVPLHCSAIGKALLSAMSEKAMSKVLGQQGMVSLTAKTLTSADSLRSNLLSARSLGYIFDDEEHALGLRCLSAPIYDESAYVVAAVSVSGPTARIVDERIESLAALVKQTARAISIEIGAKMTRT